MAKIINPATAKNVKKLAIISQGIPITSIAPIKSLIVFLNIK